MVNVNAAAAVLQPPMPRMDYSHRIRNAAVVARELAFVPLVARIAADRMVAAAVDAVTMNAVAVTAMFVSSKPMMLLPVAAAAVEEPRRPRKMVR